MLLCKGPLVAKEGTGLRTEDELNPTRGRQTRIETREKEWKRRKKEVDSRAGVAEIKRSPGVDQEQSR